jgi:hypothetical protein
MGVDRLDIAIDWKIRYGDDGDGRFDVQYSDSMHTIF